MGGNPWDRNEGKFDVPSSAIPTSRIAKKLAPPATLARAIAVDLADGPDRHVEAVFFVGVDGLRMHSKPDRTPTPAPAKRGKRIR